MIERVQADQSRLERSLAVLEERIASNGKAQREAQIELLAMIRTVGDRLAQEEKETYEYRKGLAFRDGVNHSRWTLLGAGIIATFSTAGYVLGAASDWLLRIFGVDK